MPKYLRITKGTQLNIPKGTVLTLPTNVGREQEIFPDQKKEEFRNFIPDLVLGNDRSLSISNFTTLEQILGDDFKDNKAYFQTGIIIAKHQKNRTTTKHMLTDLNVADRSPRAASICWAGTPVGAAASWQPQKLTRDYLNIKINWSNGKIEFAKKSQNYEPDSSVQLLNYIYPIPYESSPKYRAQDSHHEYYYVGVVFRIRDPKTGQTYCRTYYSPKCVKVSYDYNLDQIKTVLVNTGYVYN